MQDMITDRAFLDEKLAELDQLLSQAASETEASYRRACGTREEKKMDVHEYQAKELLAGFGVTVPRGAIAFSADQAVYAATELGGWHWAVKAQIHAGGRGKAGGIKICKTYHEVREAAQHMLGKRLATN